MSEVKVFCVPSLPENTMFVSQDVFDRLKGVPDKSVQNLQEQWAYLEQLIQKRKDQQS